MEENEIGKKLREMISGSADWLLELYSALKREGLTMLPQVRRLLLDVAVHPSNGNIQALHNFVSPLLNKIRKFLSPFPKPTSGTDGQIRFAVSELSMPVGINPEIDCHCLISGATKAGKSFMMLFFVMSQAIIKGIRCWIFTLTDEARQLIKICSKEIVIVKFDGKVKFNPLFSPLLPIHAWINIFADAFIQAFHIYDGSKNLLIQVLSDMVAKSLPLSLVSLYYELKNLKFPLNSRNSYYRESLLNRLGGLIAGNLGQTFDCIVGHTEKLLQSNVIFEISSLTREQQMFIVTVMTTMRFHYNLNKKEADSPYDFIGVDDGSLLFDRSLEHRPDLGMPIIDQLLATVRKSRVRIFTCTQMPSLLGKGIHSNSSVKIIFRLDNNEDLRCMLSTIGISDPALIEYCRHLGEREILVYFGAR